MKKGAWIAVMAIMTMIVSACGSNGANNNASGATVYHFASDAAYAPMEMLDKGEMVGFDIDFLKLVMEEAGLEYKLDNIPWDTMLASVEQGTEYDAGISAISIDDDRKQKYDFSVPYFESTNMILVPKDSAIASAKDLEDKDVAVQAGTTADSLMTEMLGQGNKHLKRFENNTLALMELSSNGVDAVVADIAVVQDYVKKNGDSKFKGIIDRENFASEYYGIAYPKGSELKAKLDPAIKKVLESDEYKEIYEKWIGGTPDMTALVGAQ